MMLAIAIDRDSFHAGDDLSSHASSIKLDPARNNARTVRSHTKHALLALHQRG